MAKSKPALSHLSVHIFSRDTYTSVVSTGVLAMQFAAPLAFWSLVHAYTISSIHWRDIDDTIHIDKTLDEVAPPLVLFGGSSYQYIYISICIYVSTYLHSNIIPWCCIGWMLSVFQIGRDTRSSINLASSSIPIDAHIWAQLLWILRWILSCVVCVCVYAEVIAWKFIANVARII